MKRPKNPVQITRKHVDALEAAKTETGCGAAMFLRSVDDAPRGLNSTTIHNWMSGRANEANKEHLEFALANWPKMPKRISVTSDLSKRLIAEQSRTGVGPTRLLRTMDEVPSGLNAVMISNWKSMRADKARADYVGAVLKAYACIK